MKPQVEFDLQIVLPNKQIKPHRRIAICLRLNRSDAGRVPQTSPPGSESYPPGIGKPGGYGETGGWKPAQYRLGEPARPFATRPDISLKKIHFRSLQFTSGLLQNSAVFFRASHVFLKYQGSSSSKLQKKTSLWSILLVFPTSDYSRSTFTSSSWFEFEPGRVQTGRNPLLSASWCDAIPHQFVNLSTPPKKKTQ